MRAPLATLWLLLSSPAWGWAPSELVDIDLGDTPAAVAAGTWDGVAAVVVTGAGGTSVRAIETGAVLAVLPELAGHDVMLRDLDRDGTPEILWCGEAGLALLSGSADAGLTTRVLAEGRCDRFGTYELGGYDGLVSASGGRVTTWVPVAGGLQGTPLADELDGPAVFATLGGRIAAVGAGTTTVVQLDGPPLQVDAPVLDLAAGPAGFWVVLGGEQGIRLRALAGEGDLPLARAPAGLSTLELQPGRPQLVLVDAGERRLGLLGADGMLSWLAVPTEPHRIAAAELSGDDCPDLLVVGRDGVGSVITGDCDLALPVAAVVSGDGGWERALEVDPVPDGAPADEAPEVSEAPYVPLPAPPTEHTLGDGEWGDLHLFVGQPASVWLRDGLDRAASFRSRGGPPGFATTEVGLIEFTPELDDVGVWRVSVQLERGLQQRWTGLRVHVHPNPNLTNGNTQAFLAAIASEEEARQEVEERSSVVAVRAAQPPPLGLEECQLALGVAGGMAKAGGVTWEELGQPDVRGSGSPMAVLQCLGSIRGPVGWVVGFDTAPFFEYASLPRDRTHILGWIMGVDVGSERVSAGLFGTLGVGLRPSPGVRAQLRPFGSDASPVGVEVRATWLAPQLGGEVAALWLVRL